MANDLVDPSTMPRGYGGQKPVSSLDMGLAEHDASETCADQGASRSIGEAYAESLERDVAAHAAEQVRDALVQVVDNLTIEWIRGPGDKLCLMIPVFLSQDVGKCQLFDATASLKAAMAQAENNGDAGMLRAIGEHMRDAMGNFRAPVDAGPGRQAAAAARGSAPARAKANPPTIRRGPVAPAAGQRRRTPPTNA